MRAYFDSMVHEAPILVPGCFVVMQGIPGDCMNNTIDTGPTADDHVSMQGGDHSGHGVVYYESRPENPYPVPVLVSGSIMPHVGLHATEDITLSDTLPQSVPSDDSFIVVSDVEDGRDRRTEGPEDEAIAETSFKLDPMSRAITPMEGNTELTVHERRISRPLTPSETECISKWERSCRTREQRQRSDWLELQDASETDDLWWQQDGRLVIMRELPIKGMDGFTERDVIGTLSPGSTVVAKELIHLESTSLFPILVNSSGANVYRRGRYGEIQLLHIDSPLSGYIVLSVDGYLFLAPGELQLYTDLHAWMWRVTCSAGAFVREGLELTSKLVHTLPFGSFLSVNRKVVNDMGLPRLHVQAILDDKRLVEGWISEFLNPLSGQRGPIAQPVPFPVPALYKVTLSEGAIVRADMELSSPQIGHAPVGAILTVVGRAFSEHPQEMCIERLKLAGHGGWVSVRLNKQPPLDEPILEFVGMDGLFDPDAAGLWHLFQSQRVLDNQGRGLSKLESTSSSSSQARKVVQQRSAAPERSKEDKCLICLTEVRNSTIVHGETGHIACCLICARVLKARGDRCPVCRLPIDCVIQQFWA